MSRFAAGNRVRVAKAFPPGHVRTPTFVRGLTGTVIRHFGAFPNPSLLAYGMSGWPKLDLYQVAFDMDDVWSGEGAYAPGDTVTADIYDNWLEAVPTANGPTANRPTANRPTANRPTANRPTANRPTANRDD